MKIRHIRAFTLIELSIVILVLSLLAAAAMRYSTNVTATANYANVNQTLDVIETALMNYRTANGRLPCPSDITLAETTANFGVEVGTVGDGNCTGANFLNSSTDPDSSDPLYNSAAANKVVAGSVPTKSLRLEDKYAYDSWGRKILFVVDIRSTQAGAFTTYPATDTTIGAVVVKKTATDSLANAITYKALYALVSFGPDGHGGYVRSPTVASTPFNNGSTDSDEQKNCHCSSSAVATSFDRIFVQKSKTVNSNNITGVFDDIVRFKTRGELSTNAELQ